MVGFPPRDVSASASPKHHQHVLRSEKIVKYVDRCDTYSSQIPCEYIYIVYELQYLRLDPPRVTVFAGFLCWGWEDERTGGCDSPQGSRRSPTILHRVCTHESSCDNGYQAQGIQY